MDKFATHLTTLDIVMTLYRQRENGAWMNHELNFNLFHGININNILQEIMIQPCFLGLNKYLLHSKAVK